MVERSVEMMAEYLADRLVECSVEDLVEHSAVWRDVRKVEYSAA